MAMEMMMGVELVSERDVITVKETDPSGDVTSSSSGRRYYFSCASSHPLMQSISSISSFELTDDDDAESDFEGSRRFGDLRQKFCVPMELRFKVLLVGDAHVGKTSFLWKYVSDCAVDEKRKWNATGKL